MYKVVWMLASSVYYDRFWLFFIKYKSHQFTGYRFYANKYSVFILVLFSGHLSLKWHGRMCRVKSVSFHLNCSMFILTVHLSSSSTMCMGLFEMMAFHHHPWILQLRTYHVYFSPLSSKMDLDTHCLQTSLTSLVFQNVCRPSLSDDHPDPLFFGGV